VQIVLRMIWRIVCRTLFRMILQAVHDIV
jgi:hypothetical protein